MMQMVLWLVITIARFELFFVIIKATTKVMNHMIMTMAIAMATLVAKNNAMMVSSTGNEESNA